MQQWVEKNEWRLDDAGARLQGRFDEAVSDAGLGSNAVPNATVTRARLKSRANELVDLLDSAGGTVSCEQLLTDDARHLFGYVDILGTGGSGLVIDLKTGRDAGPRISAATAHQLIFYAHLFEESYGHLPKQVVVFSLQHGSVKVEVTRQQVDELLLGIEQTLASSASVAIPDPEICRFCARRMSCEPQWKALDDWPSPDAVRGTVEKLEISSAGYVALRLSGEWVTGLSVDAVPAIAAGDHAKIVRLISRPHTIPREWLATRSTSIRVESR